MVTLEEAKQYLRVDSSAEDTLIESILESAKSICADVARLEEGEVPDNVPMMKAAIFYTVAYLYEHREEADHHDLMMSLRAILFSIRESRF